MIYFLPNILSKEECEMLAKQFDIQKKKTYSRDRVGMYGNSFGMPGSYPFDIYLDKLKNKVLEYVPYATGLENVNAYVREYLDNSFLKKHIDRKDISVTMSICLETTINKEWPLLVNIDGKDYTFNTNVGDGIILLDADKHLHWRDSLSCNENERVLQLFLHWMPITTPIKKNKTLL